MKRRVEIKMKNFTPPHATEGVNAEPLVLTGWREITLDIIS